MSDADDILEPIVGPPDYDEIWDRVDNRHYDRKGNPISLRDWVRLSAAELEYQRLAFNVIGDYDISTVWLGLDHGFGGPPMIFETMVFAHEPTWREPTEYTEGYWARESFEEVRYSTEEEALEGHAKMVAEIEDKVRLLQEATGERGDR